MEQYRHNNPDAPTPMEFNQSNMQMQKRTPEENKLIQEYLRQHPEMLPGYSNRLDGPKWLFIVVAVSMILGLILFCAGGFFYDANKDLGGWLTGIGLTLFIAVPTICAVIDKLRREKKDGANANMWSFKTNYTPAYAEEDTNFEPHTPAKWILISCGIGVVLLIASILVFPTVFTGQTAFLLGISSGFLGCLLLTVNLAADGRHDAALIWGILTAAAAGILIPGLINAAQPFRSRDILTNMILLLSGGVLMLAPLIFILFRRLTCSEIVTAACEHQDVHAERRHRTNKSNFSYTHYWKYEWNGKYYIHREYRLLRDDANLDEAPVRINPQHPHMFYRRSVPAACLWFFAVGGLIFFCTCLTLWLA